MQVRSLTSATCLATKIICHSDVTRMERHEVTLGMPEGLLLAREAYLSRPSLHAYAVGVGEIRAGTAPWTNWALFESG